VKRSTNLLFIRCYIFTYLGHYMVVNLTKLVILRTRKTLYPFRYLSKFYQLNTSEGCVKLVGHIWELSH